MCYLDGDVIQKGDGQIKHVSEINPHAAKSRDPKKQPTNDVSNILPTRHPQSAVQGDHSENLDVRGHENRRIQPRRATVNLPYTTKTSQS